jgi:hypothetical protein
MRLIHVWMDVLAGSGKKQYLKYSRKRYSFLNMYFLDIKLWKTVPRMTHFRIFLSKITQRKLFFLYTSKGETERKYDIHKRLYAYLWRQEPWRWVLLYRPRTGLSGCSIGHSFLYLTKWLSLAWIENMSEIRLTVLKEMVSREWPFYQSFHVNSAWKDAVHSVFIWIKSYQDPVASV